MYAKLRHSTILKKLVDSISKIVEDLEISVSPYGILSQSIDSSKTSLIYLNLPKEGFKENDFFCERPLSLGVNMKSFATIMKCGGNEESVTLKVESDPRALEVLFENEGEEKLSHFALSLIEINQEPVEIKDTNYTSILVIPSHKFTKICQDLSHIDDVLEISTITNCVKFSAMSDNNFSGCVIIKNENGGSNTMIEVKEPVTSKFSLNALNKFLNGGSLSEMVSFILIYLGNFVFSTKMAFIS